MPEPSVSVILPTYNRAHTLGRAIRSVLVQTFEDFELIVVDDASTDNSKEIVEALGDPRIVYVRHDTNLGGAAARNSGIARARAPLVAFQDSDDEWLPEKLERQVETFRGSENGVRAVYCGCIIHGYDGRGGYGSRLTAYVPRSDLKTISGDIRRPLLYSAFVGIPTLLVDRNALLEVGGFDHRLPCNQDWDLTLRLAGRTKFAFVDTPLHLAHTSEDSISRRKYAEALARMMIVRKQRSLFSGEPKALSEHLFCVARALTLNGKARSARRVILKAIATRPLSYKNWIALVLTFLGLQAGRWVYRFRARRNGVRPAEGLAGPDGRPHEMLK